MAAALQLGVLIHSLAVSQLENRLSPEAKKAIEGGAGLFSGFSQAVTEQNTVEYYP